MNENETELEVREFKFPHEGISVEVNPIEVEPALNVNPNVLKRDKVAIDTDDDPEIEVEVSSDVPIEDRDKLPSDPPDDITEEELKTYSSKKAAARLRHFSKGYHDERRKAEAAGRATEELKALAKSLMEENQKLKGSVHQSQTTLVDQARKTVATEIEQAEHEYELAYSTGEPDKVLAAQRKWTAALIKKDKLDNFKLPPLQKEEERVQVEPQRRSAPTLDPKVTAWRGKNKWFGPDTVMTAAALGLNQKLIVEDGYNGQSDEYYTALDAGLRKLFPDKFKEVTTQPAKSTTLPTSVVAPVARSTAPKIVRLTETQVAIAKELGITAKGYAAQVAKLNRGNVNG